MVFINYLRSRVYYISTGSNVGKWFLLLEILRLHHLYPELGIID